jgi:hypothetical protein
MKKKQSGLRSLPAESHSIVTWSDHVGIRDGQLVCDHCNGSAPLPGKYDEEAIDREEEPDKFEAQAEGRRAYLAAVADFLTKHRSCLPQKTTAKPKSKTTAKPRSETKPKSAKTTAKPKAKTGQKGLF